MPKVPLLPTGPSSRTGGVGVWCEAAQCSHSAPPRSWGHLKQLLLHPKIAWSPLRHLLRAEGAGSHQHPLLVRQFSQNSSPQAPSLPKNTEFPMESWKLGSSSTLPQSLGDVQSHKHTQKLLLQPSATP